MKLSEAANSLAPIKPKLEADPWARKKIPNVEVVLEINQY